MDDMPIDLTWRFLVTGPELTRNVHPTFDYFCPSIMFARIIAAMCRTISMQRELVSVVTLDRTRARPTANLPYPC